MASSSQAPLGIRQELLDFCKLTKSLSRHEDQVLDQLLEVVKQHLKEKCLRLVQTNQHDAVLWSYSAESTPLRTSATQVSSHAGLTVTRKGKVLQDFLLQRGLLKARPAGGEDQLAFLFTDVLPLKEGKKAGHLFSAAASFFPHLRKAGHMGIAIQHHSMDRAIFSAVGRRLEQRHKAWYTPGLGPKLGEAASLLELTDWCLGTGCCCHDVQNSVKWSLASSLPAHAQATQ